MEIVEILDVDVTHHVTHVVANELAVLIFFNSYTYAIWKEGLICQKIEAVDVVSVLEMIAAHG